MSVTVTKTATLVDTSEGWTDFLPSHLSGLDSWIAACRLGGGSSPKWGVGRGFGFSVPLDATIIGISTQAYWWGSNAGSYITLSFFGVPAYDTGAVSGRWVSGSTSSGLPTPAQANDPGASFVVGVGRTTGAAVNVFIDQLTVSVTYEPAYVAPPPPPGGPPAGLPTVVTSGVTPLTSTTAEGYGNVTSDGGSAVWTRGLCVGFSPSPRTLTINAGAGTGSFSADIVGLYPGVRYYVAAYVENAVGGSWGWDVTFVTPAQKAGDGGAGLVSSLSGQSRGYAGGGGGGMLSYGAGGGATHGGGLGKGEGWGNGNPGVINTGGGGGGSGATDLGNVEGGAGGTGVVVIRYKTADAIATSPSLGTSIFRPSLAYRGGRLFAPYSIGEDAQIGTIAGNTVAAATVISTTLYTPNIIPAMTSATTPSGVVTSSSDYAAMRANWKGFNHANASLEDGWMAASGTTAWLGYQFTTAHVFTGYAVTSSSEAAPSVRAPKTWMFQGSNDGTTWVTLDTRTNITDWAASVNVRKVFNLTNATGYLYGRLYITASNDATYVGVGELEIMETVFSWAHGILADTAQVVAISGSNSTPPINGSYVATRIDDTHFSIPVNVTTAGTSGLVLYNHSVGWAITAGGYNDIGWLTQSPTTFHTGSMKKDFRYASVSHDVLPDGATVRPMSWLIDGAYGTADGVAYSPQETRYSIDQQGYSIETTLGMTPSYTNSISPVVKGINVIWNFVKNKKHTYSLDCRSGASAGRWNDDPETALKFLYATANERATFEDRFAGVYHGAIESVEFTPAQVSLSEGPSGLAKIVVREDR